MRPRERRGRLGHDLDLAEEGPRPLGQLGRGQRARIRGSGRDESRREGREGGEHPLSVLVGEDGAHEHVGRSGVRREPAGAVRVVGAVPELGAAPFEPAREGDLHVVRCVAEEGGGGLAGPTDSVRVDEVRELVVG